MRLVLTTPPFDLFTEGYGLKKGMKKGNMPPLGLGYIASVTLKSGIDTFIVDPSVMGFGFSQTVSAIAALNPDVVGISSMTAFAGSTVKLADLLKQRLDASIIIGGPHATSFPEEILNASPNIDYVVAGEGEGVIVPLLDCIQKNKPPHGLNGVVFRAGDSIVDTAML